MCGIVGAAAQRNVYKSLSKAFVASNIAVTTLRDFR